jgi:hypothetical protein
LPFIFGFNTEIPIYIIFFPNCPNCFWENNYKVIIKLEITIQRSIIRKHFFWISVLKPKMKGKKTEKEREKRERRKKRKKIKIDI